jgi:hypothetical protein
MVMRYDADTVTMNSKWGEYVQYDDYLYLEKENEDLNNRLKELQEKMDLLGGDV